MTLLKEEYYKNLLDNLYHGIVCVDPDRKVIFWNKSAERLTGYAEEKALGKLAGKEILVYFDEHGMRKKKGDSCPIELTIADGKSRQTEFFFKHDNGQYVSASADILPIKDTQGRIHGAVQVFSNSTSEIAIQKALKKLEKQAMIDPLTGLANRRYIDKILDNKIDETQRYGLKFGLLFIDIDHFKAVNDKYGHDVGDKVLQMAANTMSSVIRTSDILGRWGGEEFVVLVLNVGEEELLGVAEKLRIAMEKARMENKGTQIKVTISIGATMSDPQKKDTKEKLLKRADDLMYTSKLKGRNQVSLRLEK